MTLTCTQQSAGCRPCPFLCRKLWKRGDFWYNFWEPVRLFNRKRRHPVVFSVFTEFHWGLWTGFSFSAKTWFSWPLDSGFCPDERHLVFLCQENSLSTSSYYWARPPQQPQLLFFLWICFFWRRWQGRCFGERGRGSRGHFQQIWLIGRKLGSGSLGESRFLEVRRGRKSRWVFSTQPASIIYRFFQGLFRSKWKMETKEHRSFYFAAFFAFDFFIEVSELEHCFRRLRRVYFCSFGGLICWGLPLFIPISRHSNSINWFDFRSFFLMEWFY